MYLATKQDLPLVRSILEYAFQNNETTLLLSRNRNAKYIIQYVTEFALLNGSIFISENYTSVILCLHSQKTNFIRLIRTLYIKIRFLIVGFPILKSRKILSHLNEIKTRRLKSEHLYVWFLGANQNSSLKSTLKFAQNFFSYSSGLSKPVLAETSIERNSIIYKRFGFKTYHTYYNKELNMHVKFMKKDS